MTRTPRPAIAAIVVLLGMLSACSTGPGLEAPLTLEPFGQATLHLQPHAGGWVRVQNHGPGMVELELLGHQDRSLAMLSLRPNGTHETELGSLSRIIVHNRAPSPTEVGLASRDANALTVEQPGVP